MKEERVCPKIENIEIGGTESLRTHKPTVCRDLQHLPYHSIVSTHDKRFLADSHAMEGGGIVSLAVDSGT